MFLFIFTENDSHGNNQSEQVKVPSSKRGYVSNRSATSNHNRFRHKHKNDKDSRTRAEESNIVSEDENKTTGSNQLEDEKRPGQNGDEVERVAKPGKANISI